MHTPKRKNAGAQGEVRGDPSDPSIGCEIKGKPVRLNLPPSSCHPSRGRKRRLGGPPPPPPDFEGGDEAHCMRGQSGGGALPGAPSSSGSHSLQTRNGEADSHGESSSRSFDQYHELPDDECSSSGAPDDFTPITAKVDVGLPPEFDPKQAYTWKGVNAPFDGQFKGLTWNSNAFFMDNTFCTKKKHSYLLRKFEKCLDFCILQEVHCSIARDRCWSDDIVSSSVKLFTSRIKEVDKQHTTAGVGIAVADHFLQRFEEYTWEDIIPGYVATLLLKGDEGILQIVCIYAPSSGRPFASWPGTSTRWRRRRTGTTSRLDCLQAAWLEVRRTSSTSSRKPRAYTNWSWASSRTSTACPLACWIGSTPTSMWLSSSSRSSTVTPFLCLPAWLIARRTLFL